MRSFDAFFPRCFVAARCVKNAARSTCVRPVGDVRTTGNVRRAVLPRPSRFDTPPTPAGKPCGLAGRPRRGLTASAQPLHSATDLGGRAKDAPFSRQTGNSGANPGRPRRCDQASRSAASRHCGFLGGREKACSRPSLGVRRPTRVRSLPDREGGMAGTAADAAGRVSSRIRCCTHPLSPWAARACAAVCGAVRLRGVVAWPLPPITVVSA